MLEWHINDLSLSGQFTDSKDFLDQIFAILRVGNSNSDFRSRLFCSSLLSDRPVLGEMSFRAVVQEFCNPDEKRQILAWISKSGPFCEAEGVQVDDNYFEYETCDVTEQGLGEASRRILHDRDVASFSFVGGTPDCDCDPLSVTQGLPEEVLCTIAVKNHTLLDDIENVLSEAAVIPSSWSDVMKYIDQKYNFLKVSSDVELQLANQPFNTNVRNRLFDLLYVLDFIAAETMEDGSLSEVGMEMREKHFVGDKAWFSDESARNKNKFESEMTFKDPCKTNNETLFCSWHGKIKTPQFRVHFEWPRPVGQRDIKICYIGPKITKE